MRFAWMHRMGMAAALAGIGAIGLPGACRADDTGRETGKFLSGAGSIAYLAAGVGLPLATDRRAGKAHALRVADALGTSAILAYGLKGLLREKRPDSTEHDSLPSGHATAAFAVATMQSQYHPRQAALWYLGAAAISASRVTLHRHTVGDVLAGAALGYGTARLELSMPRGLVLAPFIPRSDRGGGLRMTLRF